MAGIAVGLVRPNDLAGDARGRGGARHNGSGGRDEPAGQVRGIARLAGPPLRPGNRTPANSQSLDSRAISRGWVGMGPCLRCQAIRGAGLGEEPNLLLRKPRPTPTRERSPAPAAATGTASCGGSRRDVRLVLDEPTRFSFFDRPSRSEGVRLTLLRRPEGFNGVQRQGPHRRDQRSRPRPSTARSA